MAYGHGYEVHMIPVSATALPTTQVEGISLMVTGVRGTWGPNYVPHVVHGAAITPKAGVAFANAVHVGFNADITTQGTATRAFTIVLPTTATGGTSYTYTATYSIVINPGMTVQAAVTAAAAGGYGNVSLYVSPAFEQTAGATYLVATT